MILGARYNYNQFQKQLAAIPSTKWVATFGLVQVTTGNCQQAVKFLKAFTNFC